MISVLHADGDRELRDTYAELFASRGIPSRASDGGVDCLHQLREQPPGLLILDLDLPWGGGLGVLGVMREESRLRQIPVIVTSAASSSDTLNQLAVSPVVKSFPKPFRLDDLLEMTSGLHKAKAMKDNASRNGPNGDGAPVTENLSSILEREIHMHTARRVQDLCVESVDGVILVRGRVKTFHAKQLVLVAAMKVLQGSGIEPLFEVEVE